MRLRSLALGTLALGVLVAPSADAAPKKYCNLHSDPKGDVRYYIPTIDSDALDILSADVATGKNELVATLRVVTTNTANDLDSKLGFKWGVGFTANGVDYEFGVARSSGGLVPGAKQIDSPSASIGGEHLDGKLYTYKVEGNTFVWRVPRKNVKALAKPRLIFTTFRAGSMANGSSADNGSTPTSRYPDRALSCVKAK